MNIQTQGIVLKSIKYGDNTNVVTIFTEQLGRLSFFVKIKSKTSKHYKLILQPGFIVDLDFSFHQNKEIHYLNNFSLAYIYLNLHYNIVKSSILIVISEILYNVLKPHTSEKEIFNFIRLSFIHLDESLENYMNFHLIFLVKLTEFLGFNPENNYSEANLYFDIMQGTFVDSRYNEFVLDEKYSKFFNILLSDNSFFDNKNIYLTNYERTILLQNILTYYSVHIENLSEIKSLNILHEIFAN